MSIATKTYAEGQKVRILANTNCHSFKVGDIVELVKLEFKDTERAVWLATSDPKVRNWNHREASNILESEIEPVDTFKAGDRVRRNAEPHIYAGRDYQHREAAEGTLGTVTGKGYGGVAYRVQWDDGRGSVIEESGLDPYVPPTLDDVLSLTAEFKEAEEEHRSAESNVDYYKGRLDAMSERLVAATAKRDAAFAALNDALTAYKG